MTNLYHKIYEAINTGIQKALILDPNNDVSVKWKEKETSSNVNLFKKYVHNFLNNNDNESYEELIFQWKNNKDNLYKPHDFNELVQIIDNMYAVKKQNIKWVDTSDFIQIILNTGQEISINDFDDKKHTAEFIKLSNTECGHDIILNVNLLLGEAISWVKYNYRERLLNYSDIDCINSDKQINYLDILHNDYNGYEHTYHNINIKVKDINDDTYPAFSYCLSLNNKYQNYHCYLPAIGELMFIWQNCLLINFILRKVKGTQLSAYQTFMSSTEHDTYSIWGLHRGAAHYDVDNFNKVDTSIVIPLFKQIYPLFKKVN